MLRRRDFMWGAATSVGALTVLSSEMLKAAAEPTMSLNVVYPNHEGARFQFASSEAVKAGLADPGMAEVRADVAKFTDIKPTIMLGKSL